jgi:hypothetical protein
MSKYVYVMKESGDENPARWYFTSMKKAKRFAQRLLATDAYSERLRFEDKTYHCFVTANKSDSTEWRMYFIVREFMA